MQLNISKTLKSKIKGTVEKYRFEVGVLQDAPYKIPKRGVRGKHGDDVRSTYAGGPVRMKSTKDSDKTIAQVSQANRERLGFNFLTKPFAGQGRNAEIVAFVNHFFQVVGGRSQPKRLENLLQAIVRNPILRGEYKKEGKITRAIKGFSRPMIDTAQLFKAITAKVMRNV